MKTKAEETIREMREEVIRRTGLHTEEQIKDMPDDMLKDFSNVAMSIKRGVI